MMIDDEIIVNMTQSINYIVVIQGINLDKI